MWEIFKSKIRKEREAKEEIERIEAAVKLNQEYRDTIKRLNTKIDNENEKRSIKEKERVIKTNTECPRCHSHNIVDRISRIKGEMNGSSFNSGGMFSSYGCGHINGNVDTLGINKCKDCDNEWKKEENNFNYNTLSAEFDILRYVLRSFTTIEDCTFDPLDINENYSSLEDKKEKMLVSANSNFMTKYVKDFWEGTRIDVLNILIYHYISTGNSLEQYKAKEVNKYLNEDILVEKLGFIK